MEIGINKRMQVIGEKVELLAKVDHLGISLVVMHGVELTTRVMLQRIRVATRIALMRAVDGKAPKLHQSLKLVAGARHRKKMCQVDGKAQKLHQSLKLVAGAKHKKKIHQVDGRVTIGMTVQMEIGVSKKSPVTGEKVELPARLNHLGTSLVVLALGISQVMLSMIRDMEAVVLVEGEVEMEIVEAVRNLEEGGEGPLDRGSSPIGAKRIKVRMIKGMEVVGLGGEGVEEEIIGGVINLAEEGEIPLVRGSLPVGVRKIKVAHLGVVVVEMEINAVIGAIGRTGIVIQQQKRKVGANQENPMKHLHGVYQKVPV